MSECISVIIPVYNVSEYLTRCVESVLNQTYDNIEIILVDDGSTDNSGWLCDQYENKHNNIKAFHKPNGGLSSARNYGIDKAKGDYLGFVDSDDYIAPDMYKCLYTLINEGEYDISICGLFRTDGRNKVPDVKKKITVYSRDDFLKKILKINTEKPNHYAVNKLYRKKLFSNQNVRYPEGLTSEDIEGTFRLGMEANGIVETSEIKYFYTVRMNSIVMAAFGQKDLDIMKICNHLIRLADEYGNEEIYEGAKLYKKRMYFSLLCKNAMSEKRKDFNQDLYVKKSLEKIRRAYRQLMGSNMALSRKILLSMICLSYPLTSYALNVFSKVFQSKLSYRYR